MTRIQAKKIRIQIENASKLQSDNDALESKWMYKYWSSNTNYSVSCRIRYGENLYRCVQAHTSQDDWTPDATPALWTKISLEEFPEWVQPTGAQDAYALGNKVTHNNKRWISIVDNNVWMPGVYGWNEV